MAPFEQTAAWSTSSIKGADKFLDRVYALRAKYTETSTVENILHKTIKKVTEDIENFKFNTAVSAMMILVNEMEAGSFTKEDYTKLLHILAPFAPHLTEECFAELRESSSIHTSSWPVFDESKLVETTVTIAIQIAGKMRGTIEIPKNTEDSVVIDMVKKHDSYQKYVENTEPKKIIIVKNKIINIVI
jgi:leucyl-tRNA synthetase